jgi:hypothetical protein
VLYNIGYIYTRRVFHKYIPHHEVIDDIILRGKCYLEMGTILGATKLWVEKDVHVHWLKFRSDPTQER